MRKIPALLALLFGAAAIVHAAAAISDTVDVKFDQWMTPSKPAYPHDPAVAPDGSIWYTGQRANVIGRFADWADDTDAKQTASTDAIACV